MGGGSIAQASTELINWGMRALGRWSKDGFFAHDVDLLQGGPHFFLGLGLYILKMATRKDPADNNGELPSTTREVLSEATKVFSQLGFSNVVRALRIRYADGKRQGLDYEALLGRLREGAMDIFDRSFDPESRITSAAQHLSAAAARLALSLVRSVPHLPEATWGALQPLLHVEVLWSFCLVLAGWLIATTVGGLVGLAVNALLLVYGLVEL